MTEDESQTHAGSPESAGAEDLIRRAQEGNPEAREELLCAHVPALRAFVSLRLGRALRSREDSVDLVQSVLGDVLGDLDRFEYRGPGSFRQWLMRRADNKIRARGRFWSRLKRAGGFDSGPYPELIDDVRESASFLTPSRNATTREELEALERAFATLSDVDRQVILLSKLGGLSHEALAEELGRTPSATRSLLSRALAKLATQLAD